MGDQSCLAAVGQNCLAVEEEQSCPFVVEGQTCTWNDSVNVVPNSWLSGKALAHAKPSYDGLQLMLTGQFCFTMNANDRDMQGEKLCPTNTSTQILYNWSKST